MRRDHHRNGLTIVGLLQTTQLSVQSMCHRYIFSKAAALKHKHVQCCSTLKKHPRECNAQMTALNGLLQAVHCLLNRFINLEGFKVMPSLLKVPARPSYCTGLRTIHADATKQVYGSEAIITMTCNPPDAMKCYDST